MLKRQSSWYCMVLWNNLSSKWHLSHVGSNRIKCSLWLKCRWLVKMLLLVRVISHEDHIISFCNITRCCVLEKSCILSPVWGTRSFYALWKSVSYSWNHFWCKNLVCNLRTCDLQISDQINFNWQHQPCDSLRPTRGLRWKSTRDPLYTRPAVHQSSDSHSEWWAFSC